MVAGYSFSPKEFEGSAQVLMALEQNLGSTFALIEAMK